MSRPSDCPRCGASASAHTGSYCQECGEPLVKPTLTPEQAEARRRALREAWDAYPGGIQQHPDA